MADKRLVGYEVKRLSNLLKRRLGEELGCCGEGGPTGTQGMILGYLVHHREVEVFQRDIELNFKIRRSTATGILQLMEKNGLIIRAPVAHDARLKQIIMTEKAVSYTNLIEEKIDMLEALIQKDISDEELGGFFSVLDKMRANINVERKDNADD